MLINELTEHMVFFPPQRFRGSYQDSQLLDMGFRRTRDGRAWQISRQRLADLEQETLQRRQQGQPPRWFGENDESQHRDALQQTGFWGRQGAGCIFLAQDTGRICIAHRSGAVEQPGTWGTWGGAIDAGEDPAEAVRREVAEEAGYTGSLRLIPLMVFGHSSGFRYYNFLALVPQEFKPRLNWETQGWDWVEFGQWPQPLHFGLAGLLKDPESSTTIKKYIRTQEPDLESQIPEHIVKVKGGYRLVSKKSGRNLGTYPTRAGAQRRERQVQYFKHARESQHESRKKAIKIRELMTEIYRAPSWGSQSSPAPRLKSMPSGVKPFPGHPGFVYKISRRNSLGWHHGNYQVLEVIHVDHRELAGALYVQASDLLPQAQQVANVFVYDQYQRLGLASSMYGFMVRNLGKILVADQDPQGGQTPQARQMWVAMQQGIPGVVVQGWVRVDLTDYYFKDDEDRVIDAVMALGGHWLKHDRREWVIAFDVQSNRQRSELQAVIRNFLSRQVYHGESGGEYESGLLMMRAQR